MSFCVWLCTCVWVGSPVLNYASSIEGVFTCIQHVYTLECKVKREHIACKCNWSNKKHTFCLQEGHNCWPTSNYTVTTLIHPSWPYQISYKWIIWCNRGLHTYTAYTFHRPVDMRGSRGSIEPPKWSLPVSCDYCTCMTCMAYSYKSWLGSIVATTALAKDWKWWLVFSDLCDLSAAVQPLCGSSIWDRTPLGTSMWMHTGLGHFYAQWPSWHRQELVGKVWIYASSCLHHTFHT